MSISQKTYKALENWHKQEKELKFIKARVKVLEDEIKEFNKKRYKLESEERYTYTDIAIKENKYWTNDDHTYILKIGDVKRGEFFLSHKGIKDERFFSSSLGILWHCDIPITEEEYLKIYERL